MQCNPREVRSLEKVRYVTAHYDDLQGLVWVPFGVLISLVGLLAGLGFTLEAETKLVGDLLALGGGALILSMILARFVIQGYYRRRYGRVLEIENAFFRRYKTYLVVGFPLLAAVLALELAFLGRVGSLFGFVFAVGAGEAASWWPDRHFRRHWLAGAAALSACGASGFAYELISGSTLSPGYYGFLLVPVGCCLTVCGVLDHALLTGTMRDVPEEELG